MATAITKNTPEDLAHLGTAILELRVLPTVKPSDAGKFVAIAVNHDDFEIHENDFTAVSRLLSRHPKADIWLARIGAPAAYRMGCCL